MSNRTTQSALVVAGAAAGLAAATWLKRRQLVDVSTGSDELVEPESAELPIGRSADPDIDDSLSRKLLPQDDTSGAALLASNEPFASEAPTDASLDEVWNSLPGVAEGEQSEGYDAVSPEDLGSVWLERATETTHEARPHGSDPTEIPDLDSLLVSEATLASAQLVDEEEDEDNEDDDEDEDDEERIADDDLG
ncbi:MAG: hypothetical protein EOO73_04620 [Myxococcales bacterium]|nr:MAG: hypothetical protein EOO73_04620 [Myxococcales bacterium]